MNTSILTKRSSIKIAMATAMMAVGSAQAFTVDSTHQKTITIKPNVQTAQLPVVSQQPAHAQVQTVSQRVYVQPQPSHTPNVQVVQYGTPTATYTQQGSGQHAQVITQSSTPRVVATTVTPTTNTTSVPTATPTVTVSNSANFTVTSTPAGTANGNLASSAYASSFDQLAVTTSSSAVAVVDLQSGQLIYSKNIDATRSIASISKVMTAMVLLDAGLDMREEITLIASDLVGAKKASTNLKAGDRLSRSEFTLMMLMKSENPAAKALARTYPGGYDAFISAMNAKAASLGMTQTSFADSSGLDPRNVSSASDLVRMMTALSGNDRYHTIRNFSTAKSYDFNIVNYNSGDRVYKANNTSSLVRAGEHPIGISKTGFIREAGYCVVMETNINNKPAAIVLLGANASQTRWRDAENILTQLAYRR